MSEELRAKRDWIPTPWDYFFDKQGMACFVICHLKSGKMLGGLYSTNSHSSDFPNPQQIYLEELWKITPEGQFLEKVPGTLGAIIQFAECSSIEFISAEGDEL